VLSREVAGLHGEAVSGPAVVALCGGGNVANDETGNGPRNNCRPVHSSMAETMAFAIASRVRGLTMGVVSCALLDPWARIVLSVEGAAVASHPGPHSRKASSGIFLRMVAAIAFTMLLLSSRHK
jgi:hypothetical protein